MPPHEKDPRLKGLDSPVFSQEWWRGVYALRRFYRDLYTDEEWAELTGDETDMDKDWLKSQGCNGVDSTG